MKRQNVVLVTLDSLRADHCGFMGYDRDTTPFLDKLAKKGVVFQNATASAVPTIASMYGVFTGEYPLLNENDAGEKWRDQIYRRRKLAEILSDAGYTTKGFTANPYATSHFGLNEGFDEFYDPNEDESGWISRVASDLTHLGEDVSSISSAVGIAKTIANRERHLAPAENFLEPVKEFVARVDEPYFIWLLLIDTHCPYVPQTKKWRRNNLLNFYLGQKVFRKQHDFSSWSHRQLINAYDDSILHSDNFLQQLWQELREDDPLFVVHADHGEGFGEHGYYNHPAKLYQNLVHVPLLINNSSVPSKHIPEPVSLRRISPTILDLVGIDESMQASSLLEDLGSPVYSRVFNSDERRVAVRCGPWKLLTGDARSPELYNLDEDPNEQEDTVDDNPEVRDALQQLVRKHVFTESEKRHISDQAKQIVIDT